MARRNHNSRRSHAAPGWVWMLFGLSVGLIVAIGVYLRVPTAAPTDNSTTVAVAPTVQRPAARAAPRTAESQKEQPATEERFSFYEILPQLEVEVPDDPVAPTRPAARPRPADPPGSFLLQAGSFSASADADRLQANLALLGLESHVQRVTIEDDVFHRVRIGPIDDVDAAKRTQRRLRDAGIDALLMRVPN